MEQEQDTGQRELFHEPRHHENIHVFSRFYLYIPHLPSFFLEAERPIQRNRASIGGEDLQAQLLKHGMLFRPGN